MIEPINQRQRNTVIVHNNLYIERARTLFGRHFDPVDVLFDLSGGSAGMFKVSGRRCWIRYNPWLFAKYFQENLTGTVPHEVAHYIVHRLYGLHRVQPHGREWLAVMEAFEADPSVTGKFDLRGIPQRRQRRFTYLCDCRRHQISTRRHNIMLRGEGSYQCIYCAAELTLAD